MPTADFNFATVSDMVIAEIALMYEDFTELTYEKLLDYYGVQLSIENLFPTFTRQEPENVYGIYRRGADVYYDKNYITFSNDTGTEKLTIAFSKAAHRPNDSLSIVEEQLHFTKINGHQIAVFQYMDENDISHYYAELLQNDTGWYVDASGINEDDFLRVLLSIVTPTTFQETQTITGTPIAIDSFAGYIGMQTKDNRVIGICLPNTISADHYTLIDRITVTYKGEPANINTIWAQQLIDISTVN